MLSSLLGQQEFLLGTTIRAKLNNSKDKSKAQKAPHQSQKDDNMPSLQVKASTTVNSSVTLPVVIVSSTAHHADKQITQQKSTATQSGGYLNETYDDAKLQRSRTKDVALAAAANGDEIKTLAVSMMSNFSRMRFKDFMDNVHYKKPTSTQQVHFEQENNRGQPIATNQLSHHFAQRQHSSDLQLQPKYAHFNRQERSNRFNESSSEDELLIALNDSNEQSQSSIPQAWNVNGSQRRGVHNAPHIVRQASLESLLKEYIQTESEIRPLNNNAKKQTNQQTTILDGQSGLTETFLGPSSKVRDLKKRVKQAEIQQKVSIEHLKKTQIQGRSSSYETMDYKAMASQASSGDQTYVSTGPAAWLAAQPKRFKPTSLHKWESGQTYFEEQKQRVNERMQQLAKMKKSSFHSPFNKMLSQGQNQNISFSSTTEPSQLPYKKSPTNKNSSSKHAYKNSQMASHPKAFNPNDQRHKQTNISPLRQHPMQGGNVSRNTPCAQPSDNVTINLLYDKRVERSPPTALLNDLGSDKSINNLQPMDTLTPRNAGADGNRINYPPKAAAAAKHETRGSEECSEEGATNDPGTTRMNAKNFGEASTVQLLAANQTGGGQAALNLHEESRLDRQTSDEQLLSYRLLIQPHAKVKMDKSGSQDLEYKFKADPALADGKVGKDSPYFVVNNKTKDMIHVGALVTKQHSTSRTPFESKQAKRQYETAIGSAGATSMNTKRSPAPPACQTSKKSSLARKKQAIEDPAPAEMRNYGNLAFAGPSSSQSPDANPMEVYTHQQLNKTNTIYNRRGSHHKRDDGDSCEYNVYHQQQHLQHYHKSATGGSFMVKGTALATKTSGFSSTHNKRSSQVSPTRDRSEEEVLHLQPKLQEQASATGLNKLGGASPRSASDKDDGPVETLAHNSIAARSSLRQSFDQFNQSSIKQKGDGYGEYGDDKRASTGGEKVIVFDNNIVKFDYRQSDDHGQEDGRVQMGKTSSRFSQEPLFPTSDHNNQSNRPLTSGFDQSDEPFKDLVVVDQAKVRPAPDSIESKASQSSKANEHHNLQARSGSELELNEDSSDEVVQPADTSVERPLANVVSESVDHTIKKLAIVDNHRSDPVSAASPQTVRKLIKVEQLKQEPSGADPGLQDEPYASGQKLATIDYSNTKRSKMKAQMMLIQGDHDESKILTNSQAESMLIKTLQSQGQQNSVISPFLSKNDESNENKKNAENSNSQSFYLQNKDVIHRTMNNSTLLRSLGGNSVQTELLSKLRRTQLKEKPGKDETPDDATSSKNDNNANMLTLEDDIEENAQKTLSSQRMETLLTADHNTYQTLIQNQPSKAKLQEMTSIQARKKSLEQKVSAFKMPMAQGKGDLLPALERDLKEPDKSFKNLSRLFKDKQKEQFYQKNSQLAREILRRVGTEHLQHNLSTTSKNALSKDAAASPTHHNHIHIRNRVELETETQAEAEAEAGDYFDARLSKQLLAQRDRSLAAPSGAVAEAQLSNYSFRERRSNGTEADPRRVLPSQSQLTTFRSKTKLLQAPGHYADLAAVKESREPPGLSKQQRKLNDLISLKYDMQRKRELSSMVHLSRPFDSVNNDSSMDSADYNHGSVHSLTAMGQIPTRPAGATTGASLGHRAFQVDSQTPAPRLGSHSIEIANSGGQFASSSRYQSNPPRISPRKSQLGQKLSASQQQLNGGHQYASTKHNSRLASLPLSIRQSGELKAKNAMMSIKIASVNTRRSRLSQLNLSGHQIQAHMVKHSEAAQLAAFNQTSTHKLSLDIAKANRAKAARLKAYEAEGDGAHSQNDLSFECAGALTVKRPSDRAEYDASAKPNITTQSALLATRSLGEEPAHERSLGRRTSDDRRLNKTALGANQTTNLQLAGAANPRSLSNREDSLELGAEPGRSDSAQGAGPIVVEMKRGPHLPSQRTNSLARVQTKEPLASGRHGGKPTSTSLLRKPDPGSKAVVPVSKMPILIVDSSQKASKQVKSYKWRKVIDSVVQSKKSRLPNIFL